LVAEDLPLRGLVPHGLAAGVGDVVLAKALHQHVHREAFFGVQQWSKPGRTTL
jgi:hypothetical protein